MAEALDTASPETTETTTTPDAPAEAGMFAGKFNTVEALEQGYKSLESKLGDPARGQPPATPTTPTTPATPATPEAPAAAPPAPQQQGENLGVQRPAPVDANSPSEFVTGILQSAGLDATQVAQQYATTNQLLPEQYAALERVNSAYNKVAVDTFLQGQQSTAELMVSNEQRMKQAAIGTAGGEQQLTTLLAWAGANLNDAELDYYNNQVTGPAANDVSSQAAVQWLMTKHTTSIGATGSGSAVPGEAPPPTGGGGFSSAAEFNAAFTEARSKNLYADPAFQERVAATSPEIIEAAGAM